MLSFEDDVPMLGLRPEQVAAEFDAFLAGLARRGEDRAVLSS